MFGDVDGVVFCVVYDVLMLVVEGFYCIGYCFYVNGVEWCGWVVLMLVDLYG